MGSIPRWDVLPKFEIGFLAGEAAGFCPGHLPERGKKNLKGCSPLVSEATSNSPGWGLGLAQVASLKSQQRRGYP